MLVGALLMINNASSSILLFTMWMLGIATVVIPYLKLARLSGEWGIIEMGIHQQFKHNLTKSQVIEITRQMSDIPAKKLEPRLLEDFRLNPYEREQLLALFLKLKREVDTNDEHIPS